VYLFIAFMALLAWHVTEHLLDRKERRELLNRVMSKNYQEFEYYDKKYPTDIKEMEELRDEARDARKTQPLKDSDFEQDIPKDVAKFLDATETDWRPDEVDVDKIKEMIDGQHPLDAEDRD